MSGMVKSRTVGEKGMGGTRSWWAVAAAVANGTRLPDTAVEMNKCMEPDQMTNHGETEGNGMQDRKNSDNLGLLRKKLAMLRS